MITKLILNFLKIIRTILKISHVFLFMYDIIYLKWNHNFQSIFRIVFLSKQVSKNFLNKL